MISIADFRALKYGDEIKVLVHEVGSAKRVIDDDYSFVDENNIGKDYNWHYLPCTGYIKEIGKVSLIIDMASGFSNWEFRVDYDYGTIKKYLPSDFDSSNKGGWWLWREAIHSKRVDEPIAKKDVETPPLPCIECLRFYPMALPNFEEKLVCYSCRDSMQWKYTVDKSTGKVHART